MTITVLKRTLLLLVAVAAFSLPGCGLFCDDESSPSYDPEQYEGEAQGETNTEDASQGVTSQD